MSEGEGGHRMDSKLPSGPIITKVVSSNPAHGAAYLIQHCDTVCQ